MDTIELGGNIRLTGFSELDGGQMIVLKKIIGNYARKLSDMNGDFNGLSITLNHDKDYDLHGELAKADGVVEADANSKNLFMGVDAVLKKIEASL